MRKFKMWYIKLAFAALFFAGIAGMNIMPMYQEVEAKNIKTQKTVVQTTTNSASGKSVMPIKNYPYTLSIPKMNVNAGVLAMGLEQDGKMAVPNNFTEVGWFSLGTKPGDVGNAVLGAHVDNGGSKPGVFKNLKTLEQNDLIYMTDAAGKVQTFKVTEKIVLSKNTTATQKVFSNDTKRYLVLITCHGTWLPGENTYSDRLIVYAELAS